MTIDNCKRKHLVWSRALLCLLCLFVPLGRSACADDPGAAKTTPEVVKMTLKDEPRAGDSPPSLPGMVASVAVNSVQSGGIRVTLGILNTGPSAYELYNPLELLLVRLYDENGDSVRLPRVDNRLLMSSRNNKIALPFKIEEVRTNEKVWTVADLSCTSVPFSVGTRMRIIFVIDRIQQPPYGPTLAPTSVIPIPPGAYTLRIDEIFGKMGGTDHRTVASNPISVRVQAAQASADTQNDPLKKTGDTAAFRFSVQDADLTLRPNLVDGSYDFGQVHGVHGGPIQHVFVLKNNSASDVVIRSINTSCGCTSAALGEATPEPLPMTVAAGQQFRVTVSVDPVQLAEHDVHKYVWVTLQGQDQPAATLMITGKFVRAVSFLPGMLDFGKVARKDLRPLLLTVALDPQGSVQPRDVTLVSSNPLFQITPLPDKKLANAKRLSYRISISPQAPDGALQGRLSVLRRKSAVGTAPLPAVSVPVFAELTGPVHASPAAAIFGTVLPNTERTLALVLNGSDRDFLQSLTVTSSDPQLSAHLADTEAAATGGYQRELSLTLRPATPGTNLQNMVTVSSGRGDRLVIPVSAIVTPLVGAP